MVHGVSPLFISAAAGYWVLTQAAKEKGRVKQLGQWLGIAIIALSVAGAACKLYLITSACATGKPYCPFVGKSVPSTGDQPGR
jgi:hypothetical protein